MSETQRLAVFLLFVAGLFTMVFGLPILALYLTYVTLKWAVINGHVEHLFFGVSIFLYVCWRGRPTDRDW